MLFTLSMQLSGLPIAQGRRNNKRTEKNKMTWKEGNEFVRNADTESKKSI
jgi:hypothetical protein